MTPARSGGGGLPGTQAYTIAHTTDEEWAAFVASIIDDLAKLKQLQDAGLLPTEEEIVPDGSLSILHQSLLREIRKKLDA